MAFIEFYYIILSRTGEHCLWVYTPAEYYLPFQLTLLLSPPLLPLWRYENGNAAI